MSKKVLVAMSGGVDSSMAAYLVKKDGYNPIGVTVKTWPKEECGATGDKLCCSLEGVGFARAVCGQIGIPHYTLDFSKDFKERVVDYFNREYAQARTPNPCILCNSEIKFKLLLNKAKALGCDFIATGHYARIDSCIEGAGKRYILKEARDKKKDQSYFLFNLSQNQLRNILFPLGGMTKKQVIGSAAKLNLRSARRPSSQDICFVADKDYGRYLGKRYKRAFKPGPIVDKSGNVLGVHKGIDLYTVGQRKGLGIAYKEPLYVVAMDKTKNFIIAGTYKERFKKELEAGDINWICKGRIKKPLKLYAKIRYSAKKSACRVYFLNENKVRIVFENPQESPAPGQAVVFYDKDRVAGGGWIDRIIR